MKLLKRFLSAAVSAVCAISALSGSLSLTSFAEITPLSDSREKIERVVELVNEERAKKGVAPVTLNETMTEAAMLRAEEIVESFSHTRPDGTSCFTVLDDYEIGYYGCAENIAAGSSTAAATMNQWVNSSGHYANLMDSSYSEIGVGVAYDPESTYGYYWVQLFIDPTDPIPAVTTTKATTAAATTTTTTIPTMTINPTTSTTTTTSTYRTYATSDLVTEASGTDITRTSASVTTTEIYIGAPHITCVVY